MASESLEQQLAFAKKVCAFNAAHIKELEQQLAQAREENERLKQRIEEDRADAASLFPKIERLQAIGQDLHRKETEAAQRLHEERQRNIWVEGAMRALLERANKWFMRPIGMDAETMQLAMDMSAFLAEHPS